MNDPPPPTRVRRNRSDDPARDERGFVLVGVVMFVLALTILGISLFSLSNYEAQFLQDSYDHTGAYYAAVGAVERTKYVLSATGQLDAAAKSLPPDVVYARAFQKGDSTGQVDWSDTSSAANIQISVLTMHGKESTKIEATYNAQSAMPLYRDVIAAESRIWVKPYYWHNKLSENIQVYGRIRQNYFDLSEWEDLIGGSPFPTTGGVPVPEVDDFINTYLPSSTGAPVDGSNHSYTFNGGSDSTSFRIYNGPDRQWVSNPLYGLSDGNSAMLFQVNGVPQSTSIWLLPRGARFDETVTIQGFSNTNLIIVAKATADSTFHSLTGANVGLYFGGNLKVQGPNVFLISDGAIVFERNDDQEDFSSVPFIAMFACGVYLEGPVKPNTSNTPVLQLHNSGTADNVLGPLYDRSLLPNTLGRNRKFTLVSWKEDSK